MADGYPVQIYKAIGDRRKLDVAVIEQIMQPVRDIPVGIVSINGIKRSGKSFLLNFFLQYLISTDKANWFPAQNGSLDGFSWRGGQKRQTVGIWMWSTPFLIKNPKTGDQMGIILMDTQGSFDAQTSFEENALLFAISVWLSSAFIYNDKGDLTEDKLQFVEYFADFSSNIDEDTSQSSDGPLFQHLLFLIRDWVSPGDYSYGWHTASEPSVNNYMHAFSCAGENGYGEEAIATRSEILSKFVETTSYLLPLPGLKVQGNQGSELPNLDEIEPDFLMYVRELVPLIFEQIIQPRVFYGEVATGDVMMTMIKKWSSLIENNEIPEVKDLNRATAESHLEMALNRLVKLYQAKLLEESCHGSSDDHFMLLAGQIKQEITDKFSATVARWPKYAEDYKRQLDTRLELDVLTYIEFNNSKRLEKEQQAKIAMIEKETANLGEAIRLQKDEIARQEVQLQHTRQMLAEERRRKEAEIEAQRQRLQQMEEENARRMEEQAKQIAILQELAAKPPRIIYKKKKSRCVIS